MKYETEKEENETVHGGQITLPWIEIM